MTLKTDMEDRKRKILLRNLNSVLTCKLCGGYFVDATALVECLHAFCRGCIVKHFESKLECPICKTVYKKKSQSCFRQDCQLQALVYKMVPGLYSKEMQRREDFYRSAGVRADSSCSDDSILERERDLVKEEDEKLSRHVSERFFGPDDLISLSLEYYRSYLDTSNEDCDKVKTNNNDSTSDMNQVCAVAVTNGEGGFGKDKVQNDGVKRFLQCAAALSMRHLQKFVRMKFGLTGDHKVDIIYKGEVLPVEFTLMDVAYTFNWAKVKPMRFFYRIFTPMKIRPIKIVNATLSTGGKQLQIVKANAEKERKELREESESEKSHKETLFAHLKLQSKSKVLEQAKAVPENKVQDCVFDYNERDPEEIKRFAEKRDREWALQKQADEAHHHSKKRKKSKHKNESLYKKRKLHAEITSNEKEDLKLKMKITSHNGHKHKHKEVVEKLEAEAKEKLLQMRQIRHKALEEKKVDKVEVKVQEKVEVKSYLGDRPKVGFVCNNNKLMEKVAAPAKPAFDANVLNKYPLGFTVSKIEQGVKRKVEEPGKIQDKRPSLEITVIPSKPDPKPILKRPPPATIPLEKIKKSVTIGVKPGISIIPKPPERCDNIGALDLTKTKMDVKADLVNGGNKEKHSAVQLSNLQMLSKVASEHSVKQMPSLQTLKIPQKKPLALPKLNEIQNFRQIRAPRPNQANQSIRNIPNPSLLIRQHQIQNRLVEVQKEIKDGGSVSTANSNSGTPSGKVLSLEPKMDKQEISV